MVFPVVMYGYESWTVKKAECRRIDAFELWCWRRLLRVPCTARRSNQSILKEISPGCSLEGLMLKLKLQYFGHLMWRTDSFEKILMLGKIEGRRRRDDRGWDGWMASLTQGTWVWVDSRVGDGQGGLACGNSWGRKESDTTEWLNWTETEQWGIPYSSHLDTMFCFLAAAAKSLELCQTLCDPIDGSPPGSLVPRILQARTLEWVAISFSNAWKWKVKVKSLSRVWPSVTPWTAAYQAPLSMGFITKFRIQTRKVLNRI